MKQYWEEQLHKYKRINPKEPLISLPVFNNDDNIVAWLRPITADFLQTLPNLVPTMSRWRVENPTISAAEFTVTDRRTLAWLDSSIVNNDDRIVFVIIGLDGRMLGHIGFTEFDENEVKAEVDSVLRGEKDVIPGLMRFSMRTLISWGFDQLCLKNIYLKVMQDNDHAVNFYRSFGFTDVQLIPLEKQTLPDETRWVISDKQDAERHYLLMEYGGESNAD